MANTYLCQGSSRFFGADWILPKICQGYWFNQQTVDFTTKEGRDDKIFTSAVWQELFKLTGTALRMSTSYHPQTDGQTERVNQCLEAYLRYFVHACPTKWKQWLSLAEFWYNTSYHTSLGKTPFEVVYGQTPRHFGIDIVESCVVPNLQMWLIDRKMMLQLLQQHLLRAQQRQKHLS